VWWPGRTSYLETDNRSGIGSDESHVRLRQPEFRRSDKNAGPLASRLGLDAVAREGASSSETPNNNRQAFRPAGHGMLCSAP